MRSIIERPESCCCEVLGMRFPAPSGHIYTHLIGMRTLKRKNERFWHAKSSGDPTFPMSRGTKLNYRICTLYFLSYTFGWWWESRTPRHSRSKNQVTSRAWHHAVRLMMVSLLTICQFARADSSLGANLARAFYIISKGRSTNDRGEPAVSYKWTGWSSRLQENYRSL